MKDLDILVTGAAGFIGAAVCKKLLSQNKKVIGVDNINDYYSIDLKNGRLKDLDSLFLEKGNWNFCKLSIEDNKALNNIFEKFKPKIVIHLAAQAGVRYSLVNPSSYIQSNLVGFGNILEACRNFSIENFIYASSSSVYGGNTELPFRESQEVNSPVSLYAATKKSNELMAHSYSHLYDLPSTGLRFFTVYGPWGRPDMAPMIFSDCILNNKPINIFNNGNMRRDFTYIDDIVEGIIRCAEKPAFVKNVLNNHHKIKSYSSAPHLIFNIGNNKAINLMRFIELLENYFGKKAIKNFKSMQPGDVQETLADTSNLFEWVGYRPSTSLEIGLEKFVNWYVKFHSSNM
tara:strand:+ start:362 stop:1396 length:1035 start_codon:yes stop_codon:yes gene_type:complete